MSVGPITNTLFSTASAAVSGPGGGNFAAAMSAATGSAATGSAATGSAANAARSTVSNPFSQMGTDLQSLLVQLGGSSEAKDTSATRASANSTAALHGAHGHHHGAKEGSGDLATDFANNTIN